METGVKRVASNDRQPKRPCFAENRQFGPNEFEVVHLSDGIRIIKFNLRRIVEQAKLQSDAMLADNASFREIVTKGNMLHTRCATSIYDTVFRMCIQRNPLNFSKKCYELVDEIIAEFLQDPTSALANTPFDDTELFLEELIKLVSISLNLLHAVTFGFSYLDRFYTPNYDLKEVVTKAKEFTRTLLNHVFDLEALKDLSNFQTIQQLEQLAVIFSQKPPVKLTVPSQSCLFEEEDLVSINQAILKRTFQITPLTIPLVRASISIIVFKFLS